MTTVGVITIIKEVCIENFTHVEELIQKGANRFELCDNLAVGGTTPSYGVMKKTVEYCNSNKIPVMVMIRPRPGNYVYSDAEKDIMLYDVEIVQHVGPAGIVIGALTEEKTLDKPFLKKIAKKAAKANVESTFHMAFDDIPESQQEESIHWLVEQGFSRILTHGGTFDQSILDHKQHLVKLINTNKHMIILLGGGITTKNLSLIEKELGVKEAHGTKIV